MPGFLTDGHIYYQTFAPLHVCCAQYYLLCLLNQVDHYLLSSIGTANKY